MDTNGVSRIEIALCAAARFQANLHNALVNLQGELIDDGAKVQLDPDLFLTSTSIGDSITEAAKKLRIEIPVEFDRGDVAETAVHLFNELDHIGELLTGVDELVACKTLTRAMQSVCED